MSRRASVLRELTGLLLIGLVGCDASVQSDQPDAQANDASVPDDGGADGNAVVDGATDASSADQDAGVAQAPALWSFRVENITRAALSTGGLWLEAPGATSVLGVPITSWGIVDVILAWKTTLPTATPALVTRYPYLTKLTGPALGENANGLAHYPAYTATLQEQAGVMARGRLREVPRVFTYDSVNALWDPCTGDGFYCGIVPGQVGIQYERASNDISMKRIRPQTTGSVAADSIQGYNDLVVAGRMSQDDFDFGAPQTGFVKTGPAVFLASYTLPFAASDPFDVAWVQAFPVTSVLPAISPNNKDDDPGFGARLCPYVQGATSWLLTAPFAGTMDLGVAGKLVAPAGSYSTAFVQLDATTGQVLLGKAFGKGPASASKPTHGMVVTAANGQYVYVDTIWDSIDLGGKTASASQGADVLVATLDAAGNATSIRVFGGPGDDEVLDAMPDKGDVIIVGRSQKSIDFGNGPLSTSGTEVWVARFSP